MSTRVLPCPACPAYPVQWDSHCIVCAVPRPRPLGYTAHGQSRPMTVTVAHVPEAMAIEYHLLELSVGPALPPAPDVTAWRAAVDELRARYGLRPIDPVTGKLDW